MSKEQKTNFSFHDVFPNADFSCNREEEVFQYFQRLLSDKDAEGFEEHLKTCSLCAKRLADLHETNEAGELTAIDARKADQIFQQNLSKLKGRLGISEESPAKMYVRPPRSFSIPAYANVILIGLVAALIFPSYKSFVLDEEVSNLREELKQEKSKNVTPPITDYEELKQNYEKQIQSLNEEREKLTQPDLSGSAVYSVRAERSGEIQTIPIQFNETRKTFTLVLSVQNAEFKTFIVEILQDEKAIWQDEISLVDQPTAPGSLISITLKSDSMKEGNHTLKIFGKDKSGPVPLDEFRLAVKKS